MRIVVVTVVTFEAWNCKSLGALLTDMSCFSLETACERCEPSKIYTFRIFSYAVWQ